MLTCMSGSQSKLFTTVWCTLCVACNSSVITICCLFVSARPPKHLYGAADSHNGTIVRALNVAQRTERQDAEANSVKEQCQAVGRTSKATKFCSAAALSTL